MTDQEIDDWLDKYSEWTTELGTAVSIWPIKELIKRLSNTKPIGYLKVEHFRGDPGMVNTYLDYYGPLPEGGYTVYVKE